jgi:effector-binding domain-containing protein
MDSNMKITYSGPEQGIGSCFKFSSENNNVGNGKITIINSIPTDSILLDMDFMENGKTTAIFNFINSDSGVLVKWIMESDLGMNPINRWFGLLMDHLVGVDFEKGLANLENYLDSLPALNPYHIHQTDFSLGIILTIRDTANTSTMGMKLGKIYSKIAALIKKNKLIASGAPFTIYHEYSPQFFDLEAGIQIKELIQSTSEIKCTEFPITSTVMATYLGPYDETGLAYSAMEKYMQDENLSIAGPPWEVYITDPSTEPDTAKWQTDIYYPVK